MSITRYTIPTKLEKAPYKTQCKVMNEDNESHDIYIQISKNDEPRWIKMGSLLETAFSEFFTDEEFINQCVRLFHYHEDEPLQKISQLIIQKEKHKK